uniref:Uncharacterized protein n=1 Tax=Physcomitrium patens TaxID=3218 RepID=A0A7I4CPA3_PHYPA|nr:oil body-associated protein 2A-like isoform X3 [Physcomitrium patens]|eukprot:XP_024365131.1 oil body-associated protein 2A-like isoform X3 [Physcomitrella patens]
MVTHGCGASIPDDVPGGAKTLTSKVVDAGAGILQKLKPIQAFQQHICTWAIFSQNMKRKIETHHYAARLNDDFLQCAVYDSDQANARLIGVEYVISEKVFKTFPQEEKQLWHSHAFEPAVDTRAAVTIDQGRPMGESRRAGSDTEAGTQGFGKHLWEILVHMAIRPR